MGKRCIRCGKTTNSDMKFCPYCGMHFTNTEQSQNQMHQGMYHQTANNYVPYQEKNQKIKQSVKEVIGNKLNRRHIQNVLHNKKVVTVFLSLVCIISVACLIINHGKVNKGWLETHVPEELLQYTGVDEDTIRTCKVSSAKIQKQKRYDNINYVDCELMLEDEYIIRTVYCQMELQHMNSGEWILNSWHETGRGMVKVKEAYMHQIMQELHTTFGGSGKYDCEITATGGCSIKITYPVSVNTSLLEATGNVVFNLIFDKYDDSDDVQQKYPQKYALSGEPDLSGVDENWKLSGTWSAKINNAIVYCDITPTEEKSKFEYRVWSESYEDDDAEGTFEIACSLYDVSDLEVQEQVEEYMQCVTVLSMQQYHLYVCKDRLAVRHNTSGTAQIPIMGDLIEMTREN